MTRGILRPVRDYMSTAVVRIEAAESLSVADRMMRREQASALVVYDGGSPCGLISRSDLLRVAHRTAVRDGVMTALELPEREVAEVQTSPLLSVAPEESIARAAAEMVERHIHRLAVRVASDVVGVLSTKDIMRAVLEARLNAPISSFMSTPIVAVSANDPLRHAVERLARGDVSALVVKEEQWPIGIFTQEEALAARDWSGTTPVEAAMNQALLCLPVDTPLFRAAGFAISTSARRILAVEHHHARGFLSGIDFARAAAGSDDSGSSVSPTPWRARSGRRQ